MLLDYFRNPSTRSLQLTGEGPRLFLAKYGARLAAVGAVAVVVIAAVARRQ